MMPQVGDEVCYRALAGGVWRAEVTALRADVTIDLHVLSGGRGLDLSKTRWRDPDIGECGTAFPAPEAASGGVPVGMAA